MECEDCFHVQTSIVVEDFREYKYSTPEAVRPYLEDQAKDLKSRYTEAKIVVEIGANNGMNVEILGKHFDSVIGVDPAGEWPVWPLRFDMKTAEVIERRVGKVDLIVANHVFAHIDDLHEVFEAIDYLLKDNGHLVFEVGNFSKMAMEGRYDTIYHEHLDQHTHTPWQGFINKYNLTGVFSHTSFQGGSMKFHCHRGQRPYLDTILSKIPWREYVVHIQKNQDTLLAKLPERFCIWGATAKATTLIHQLGIKDRVGWCEDNTPAKQGMYLPGTAIPILPPGHLLAPLPTLLTAWNFEEEFKRQYPDREYFTPYE